MVDPIYMMPNMLRGKRLMQKKNGKYHISLS